MEFGLEPLEVSCFVGANFLSMFGALIGDIEGSIYEFNPIKTKDFDIYNPRCFFTDDSVMTLAVMDICARGYLGDRQKIITTLREWGHKYPRAGYGGRFSRWLRSDTVDGYNSCGNGAAMRISPIGWFANTEEDVKRYSRAVTEVTHDHPYGLLGAEVTAMCIFYARKGKTKKFIKTYIEQYFDVNFDFDELVKTFGHEEETIQKTLPQALYCFLISNDFEDCLKNIICIGGDCDTTGAIACSIAEAFYGSVDPLLKKMALSRFSKDERAVELLTNKNVLNMFHENL